MLLSKTCGTIGRVQGFAAPEYCENNVLSFTERSLEPNSSSAIMSKKEQVLVIEPPIGLSSFQRLASMLLVYLWLTRNDLFMFLSELTFTGPFTSAVSSYMKLKNPSDKKVLRILIQEWNFCLTYNTRSASRSRQQLPSGIA